MATFILRSVVAELRKKHGRQPTRKQLAEKLGMSESSIYRFPFGKTVLDLAYLDRNLAQSNDKDLGEESCEDATNPRQSEYDQIARDDYALQYRPQIPSRDYFAAETKRQLRKLKTNSFELAWEQHNTGGVRGGALLAFPVDKLEAKRRLERLSEPETTEGDCESRATVRRYSRQNRRSAELEECDSTFGSWAVAAYAVEQDGKCRWWTNFNRSAGRTDSVACAQREILVVIGRSRPRFPIVNLREMLGDSQP